jgi:positive regulator of sigma E activity
MLSCCQSQSGCGGEEEKNLDPATNQILAIQIAPDHFTVPAYKI